MPNRVVAAGAAWLFAWVVYVIVLTIGGFDGMIFMILMPATGAVVTAGLVAGALLAGLLLHIPWLHVRWTRQVAFRLVSSGAAMLLLMLPAVVTMGLRSEADNTPLPVLIITLARLGVAGYLSVIFGIANWPVQPRPC